MIRSIAIAALFVPLMVFGQDPGGVFPEWTGEVNIDFQDRPLEQVLEDLAKRFEVRFSYVPEWIDGILVNSSGDANGLVEALASVLSGSGLRFSVIDSGHIALFKKPDDTSGGLPKFEESEWTSRVRGVVLDSATLEPVIYANLIVVDGPFGTSSGLDGRFEIAGVPVGKHRLKVSSIGYRPLFRSFAAFQPEIDLDTLLLSPEDLRGDSVVIIGEKETWKISDRKLRLQPSTRILDQEMIESVPVVLEPDLFWALQSLPGVSAPNDLSNELYVRGGSPDQNLISLDRAVLYQPNHLFGIAGIFNTDMIDWVHFSSGGFSAQYGNRLSSVVDVRTSSNASKPIEGSGNISLLSSKLTLEGEPNSRWHYLVSGRRTYLDKATELWKSVGQIKESVPYHFYDLLSKATYRPNDEHTIAVWALLSRDQFDVATGDLAIEVDNDEPFYYSDISGLNLHWDNVVFNGYWHFGRGDPFSSRATAFISKAENDMGFYGEYRLESGAPDSVVLVVDSLNAGRFSPAEVDNRIVDKTVRWDAELNMSEDHQLLFGFELSRIELSYFWDLGEEDAGDPTGTEPVQVFFDYFPGRFKYRSNVTNTAMYLEDIWLVSKKLGLKPGFRFEQFEHSNPRYTVSPRFSARYDHNSSFALKASTGIYYQSLFRSRERGFVGFLEVPFSTADTRLQKAVHYVVGTEYFFDENRKLAVDLYYKTLDNMVKNRGSSDSLPKFVVGSGEAYGAELDFVTRGKKYSLQVTYVLSWAKRNFDNGSYLTNYDQRHHLSIAGRYDLFRGWVMDFRWTFRSGTPFTPSQFGVRDVFFDAVSGSLIDTGENGTLSDARAGTVPLENSGRFPFYHRLDVSVSRVFEFEHWKFQPYLSVVNSYYKTNPFYYYYSGGRLKSVALPIIPTFGAKFDF